MAFEKNTDRIFLFGALIILVTHVIGIFAGIPEDQQLIHSILNLGASFLILFARGKTNDTLVSFVYGLGFVIIFTSHLQMLILGIPQTNVLDHNIVNLIAYFLILVARNRMSSFRN